MKTVAVALALFSTAAYAQPTEFDAASVKLETPPKDGRFRVGGGFGPGQFTGEYMTMYELIQAAYSVPAGRKILGPDWISSNESRGYNITAKASGPVTPAQLRVMLQNLLAARFHLKVHTEDQPAPIYALVVTGKGIKLTPVKFDGPDPNAGAIHPIQNGVEFKHASMAIVANYLAGGFVNFGRPVIDATGIKDFFDFDLHFATKGFSAILDPPIDSEYPSIFSAIQGIGLKLESRQGAMTAYIVDYVEKVPVEN